MFQETIIIFGVIYIIIWLFYKDSVAEFRINQVEWLKRGNVTALLSEKVPIVVRGVPKLSVWTHDDVINRDIYHSVPIFRNKLISDWIEEVRGLDNLECPWDMPHARLLGERSAFQTWNDRWLSEWIIQSHWKWFWRTFPSCWTGARPMFRTVAPWTVIVPTAGEMMISIFPSKEFDYALPANWRELWIPHINSFDTPFAGELKFMDICLRPGHILLLPAHWYASWEESELDDTERRELGLEIPLMAAVMEYHTLFSVIEDWKELKFGSRWRSRKDGKEKRGKITASAGPGTGAPSYDGPIGSQSPYQEIRTETARLPDPSVASGAEFPGEPAQPVQPIQPEQPVQPPQPISFQPYRDPEDGDGANGSPGDIPKYREFTG